MKTLVIHPSDRSTDFLKPIYETIPDKTVITGDKTRDEVDELIKTHDRVIMMGHGCPYGLFSIGRFKDAIGGLIISDRTADLLREKKDNVYIWCNADGYVRPNDLNGFFSGMFVSERGEAFGCGIRNPNQKEVTESNDMFAQILSKHINETSAVIHENVKREYEEFSKTNRVAQYNNDRLFVA